ncbi:LppX_LprAFG lipoprotein [Actinomadura spongiicola]|uniref:LppX_LprAFG lipoprotein n=1 Tax=Actinomadura spongiicola TaxID=2303421 RepID=A0A372GL77_9ACTN|nr:LppX_LprAFG lipoprotein [Actinomadura spongiicola]RFS86137.1 LppX_LprAFG lipoprotein [Actinomadura spongiicola]
MIRRFAAGTVLATGLALSLTGCLGDAGNKVDEAGKNLKLSAAQVLGKTAENTGRADSFKAELSLEVTGSSEGNVSATGGMQYRSKPDLAYSMSFDKMTVGAQSMGGMQYVLVDRTMYMKIPMLSQLGAGTGAANKPWLKISLDELGQRSGMNIDELLKQSQQMDPVQNTKMLTASKDAREVGKETIGGVETTHYTGTYQMEDAIAKLTPEQQQAVRKNYSELGMGTMSFDLWVDDEQLPRKLAMKSPQTAQGAMSISMTYRDYGKPVVVTAPPANEVTDLSKMLNGLGGGGGLPGS